MFDLDPMNPRPLDERRAERVWLASSWLTTMMQPSAGRYLWRPEWQCQVTEAELVDAMRELGLAVREDGSEAVIVTLWTMAGQRNGEPAPVPLPVV